MEDFQKEMPAPKYYKVEEEGVRIKFEVVVPFARRSESSDSGSVPCYRVSSAGAIPIPVEKLDSRHFPSQRMTHAKEGPNGENDNSPPPRPMPTISRSQSGPNAQSTRSSRFTADEEEILLKCIIELVQGSPNLNDTDRAQDISQQPFWEGDSSSIVAIYNNRIKRAFNDNSMSCPPNRVASSLRNKWRDLRKKIQAGPTGFFIRYSNSFSGDEKQTLLELSEEKPKRRMTESKTGRRADRIVACRCRDSSVEATHHHPLGNNGGSQGMYRGRQSSFYCRSGSERTRHRAPGDRRVSYSTERRQTRPSCDLRTPNYQLSGNSRNFNFPCRPRSTGQRDLNHIQSRSSADCRDVDSVYDRPSEKRRAMKTTGFRQPRDRDVSEVQGARFSDRNGFLGSRRQQPITIVNNRKSRCLDAPCHQQSQQRRIVEVAGSPRTGQDGILETPSQGVQGRRNSSGDNVSQDQSRQNSRQLNISNPPGPPNDGQQNNLEALVNQHLGQPSDLEVSRSQQSGSARLSTGHQIILSDQGR